jgi:hypothetical protein
MGQENWEMAEKVLTEVDQFSVYGKVLLRVRNGMSSIVLNLKQEIDDC